jgi:hypothetical protein
VREHWARFGRNYFSRYDYEEVDSKEGDEVMSHIEKQIKDGSLVGKKLAGGEGTNRREYTVASADNFEYTDPIDKSLSTNQVITLFLLFPTNSKRFFESYLLSRKQRDNSCSLFYIFFGFFLLFPILTFFSVWLVKHILILLFGTEGCNSPHLLPFILLPQFFPHFAYHIFGKITPFGTGSSGVTISIYLLFPLLPLLSLLPLPPLPLFFSPFSFLTVSLGFCESPRMEGI